MKRLIPLLLIFVAMPSLAQQFDVEVIIFKRITETDAIMEPWSEIPSDIQMAQVGDLNDINYLREKGVQLLPRSEYQWLNQAQRLRNSSEFEVLLHTAWMQGDQDKEAAPAFHIQAGQLFKRQTVPDRDISEPDISPEFYELDGKLQVYIKHYAYAEVEFNFSVPGVEIIESDILMQTNPLPIESLPNDIDMMLDIESALEINNGTNHALANTEVPDEPSLFVDPSSEPEPEVPVMAKTKTERALIKTYKMDQSRRIRNNEMHYLDHPLIGMLIQIRPH